MDEEEIKSALIEFIQREFPWGDSVEELDETTPLLERGVLDSLRAMLLLTHVRNELGIDVVPAEVDPMDLRDVRSIAAMLMKAPAVSSLGGDAR